MYLCPRDSHRGLPHHEESETERRRRAPAAGGAAVAGPRQLASIVDQRTAAQLWSMAKLAPVVSAGARAASGRVRPTYLPSRFARPPASGLETFQPSSLVLVEQIY
eukprot:938678-Prymnesium_polylepis.1